MTQYEIAVRTPTNTEWVTIPIRCTSAAEAMEWQRDLLTRHPGITVAVNKVDVSRVDLQGVCGND